MRWDKTHIMSVSSLGKNFWSNQNVLITGLTGFIGCWLSEKLLENGAKVIGYDLSDTGALPLHPGLKEKITLIKGDILDQKNLEDAFRKHGVNICFHLAGQSMVEVGDSSPLPTFEINARGTWVVLEAARNTGVERIVVSSSNAVYGDQKYFPTPEDAPLNGSHPYGASKVCTDVIARSYAKTCKINVVVCRQTNTYGGGDFHLTHIVPHTILAVLRGENPIIKSDGTPTKAYLYVEDTVSGYLRLAEEAHRPDVGGQAFNITTESPTVLELVRTIVEVSGNKNLKPEVRGTPETTRHDKEFLSMEKSAKVLGWKARFTLQDGLKKTFEWYKNNQELVEQYGKKTAH